MFINIIYVGAGYAKPSREGKAGAYVKAAGRVCAAHTVCRCFYRVFFLSFI